MRTYHRESTVDIAASAGSVFEFLDDPRRLAGHMDQRSAMMLGSRLAIEVDQQGGQALGSTIRMEGKVLGIPLRLEEVISEREPPTSKRWQTVGSPRLLVMGPYQMGFEIEPASAGSRVRVFIDYQLPERGLARLLGWLLGGRYARWCTQRMTRDAADYFGDRARATPPASPSPDRRPGSRTGARPAGSRQERGPTPDHDAYPGNGRHPPGAG